MTTCPGAPTSDYHPGDVVATCPGAPTSDYQTGNVVATCPGAWPYRVSARTGWRSVRLLRLGEIGSLMYSFSLSVTACTIVKTYPSLRYTSMLLGH